MKIKIKNPILGVPITIIDKIADDGFIHCTHISEETVNKTFKVEGHEHDLNDEHESVSQLTINGGVGKFKRILIKLIVIWAYNYSKDTKGKSWNTKINSNYIYKRILIQKYEK